jgi:hypothetical protein
MLTWLSADSFELALVWQSPGLARSTERIPSRRKGWGVSILLGIWNI